MKVSADCTAQQLIITNKLFPAKVNQIATCSGHCDGPACIQLASGPVRSLCY